MSATGATGRDWSRFVGYGSGDFGLNLFWQGAGFYLFFYLSSVAGLNAGFVGSLLLIVAVWEAVFDPVIGFIAERTRSKLGRYRPYLLLGALPLGFAFALLFNLPTGPDGIASPWWAGFALIAFRTGYGLVSIPYAALGARVTRDFDGRTRLAGIRMYCGFIGGLAISYAGRELQNTYSDASAFGLLGIGAGIAGALVIIISALMVGPVDKQPLEDEQGPSDRPSLAQEFKALTLNRPFLVIVAALALITIATSMVGQTMLFFFEATLKDRDLGNQALLIMAGGPIITIPLWSAITLRLGKRSAWLLAAAFAAGGALSLYLTGALSAYAAMAGVCVTVLGLSGFGVIYWAALPDTIEHGAARTGIASEALLIGAASSVQKISIGIAAYLLGRLLDAISFKPGGEATPETANAVGLIFAGVPLVCLTASILVMLFYSIDRASHRRDLERFNTSPHRQSEEI